MSVDTDITVGINYLLLYIYIKFICLLYNYTDNKHSLSYLIVDFIFPDELLVHVIALCLKIVRTRNIANF